MPRHLLSRALFAGTLLLGSVATMLASPASAATISHVADLTFDGQTSDIKLFDLGGVCDDCFPDAIDFTPLGLGADLEAHTSLKLTQPAKVFSTANDTLLRQGETLDLGHQLVPFPGTLSADVHWTGGFGILAEQNGQWVGVQVPGLSTGIDDVQHLSGPCNLPLPGADATTCHLTDPLFTLVDIGIPAVPGLFDLLSLKLVLVITLDVEVTHDGILTVRQATVNGQPMAGGSQGLTFDSTAKLADPLAVPCSVAVGDELGIGLTGNHVDADLSVTKGLGVDAVVTALGIEVAHATLFSDPAGTLQRQATLTAADESFVLGPVQADNEAPDLQLGWPLSGEEGAPVTFTNATVTDNCGLTTLSWWFSDGGVAFSTAGSIFPDYPQHTFADDGWYSGKVTATDAAGNSTSGTFSVLVTNQQPVAVAGPDTTAAWGRPVAFNGAGIDPSPHDQATLMYSWAFGDFTPSASGGPSTLHAYTTPGTYTATLTVTDEDGASAQSSRQVVVRRRDVTLGFLGASSGTFDTPTTLQGSLVDEYGSPVNAANVTFAVGGDQPVAASTNGAGTAAAAYTPALAAGAYPVTAAFAGTSLYTPAQTAATFTVATKDTKVTYTGAVTGAPNKVAALSATLTDATGTPLAGRSVTFTVGSQTASATTDGLGKAVTGLKLAQKNGTYTVSATFTPAGADAARYQPSSTSTAFKLQSK